MGAAEKLEQAWPSQHKHLMDGLSVRAQNVVVNALRSFPVSKIIAWKENDWERMCSGCGMQTAEEIYKWLHDTDDERSLGFRYFVGCFWED